MICGAVWTTYRHPAIISVVSSPGSDLEDELSELCVMRGPKYQKGHEWS